MKKLNRLLIYALVVGLVLTAVHVISAQQRGGMPGQGRQQMQGRQQRGQFDPEQVVQRRIDNIMQGMQELNIPDDEAAVLKTQIEALLRKNMEQSSEMRGLIDALQQALDANDDAQIRAKLDEVKKMREAHKAQAEKMEKGLLEILPLKVEAYLTVQGIVNGGGGMRFGRGFGGTRGQGMPGGPGGMRMQRGPGG